MSTTEANPAIGETPEEERLFAVLDAYVASLQTGDEAAADVELPNELVEQYPELAGMLDCLDSLETVRTSWSGDAPPAQSRSPAGRSASTTCWRKSAAGAWGSSTGHGTGRCRRTWRSS